MSSVMCGWHRQYLGDNEVVACSADSYSCLLDEEADNSLDLVVVDGGDRVDRVRDALPRYARAASRSPSRRRAERGLPGLLPPGPICGNVQPVTAGPAVAVPAGRVL